MVALTVPRGRVTSTEPMCCPKLGNGRLPNTSSWTTRGISKSGASHRPRPTSLQPAAAKVNVLRKQLKREDVDIVWQFFAFCCFQHLYCKSFSTETRLTSPGGTVRWAPNASRLISRSVKQPENFSPVQRAELPCPPRLRPLISTAAVRVKVN